MNKKKEEPKKKTNVAEEAIEVVCGERQESYGHPVVNFSNIARLWGAYRGVAFSAQDVAMMMILLKIARNMNSKKRDNLVDICGYALTAEMIDDVVG